MRWVSQCWERILLHDVTALPHSRPRAYKVERRGRKVDLSWQRVGTWRTKNGHMVDTREGDTRSAQDLEAATRRRFGGAAKADTWRTQGGHMADKWQTHGGQMAGKGQSGLRDTRRTQTRPEHIAASPEWESPAVNCLGKRAWRGSANLCKLSIDAKLYSQDGSESMAQTSMRPETTSPSPTIHSIFSDKCCFEKNKLKSRDVVLQPSPFFKETTMY